MRKLSSPFGGSSTPPKEVSLDIARQAAAATGFAAKEIAASIPEAPVSRQTPKEDGRKLSGWRRKPPRASIKITLTPKTEQAFCKLAAKRGLRRPALFYLLIEFYRNNGGNSVVKDFSPSEETKSASLAMSVEKEKKLEFWKIAEELQMTFGNALEFLLFFYKTHAKTAFPTQ